MSAKPRLDKALAVRRTHPKQQFGQADDESTYNGATACTHTCVQSIARIWTGKHWSQDQISKKAGYPWPASNKGRRGLRPSEVAAVFKSLGLPYKVVWGMSADEILKKSNMGPVLFGAAYSWTPEWYGKRYSGKVADGKPNGYAKPKSKAGKTQLVGFYGAHAYLLLGIDGTNVYVHEPNHGSPARPEKPAYDIYTPAQFRALYNSYKKTLGRTLYAFIPTKNLPV